MSQPVAYLVVALSAALSALAVCTLILRFPPGGAQRWNRTNFADRTVSLAQGPALALGATAGIVAAYVANDALLEPAGMPRSSDVLAAGVLAALGCGGLGLFDDLLGSTASKGFGGHLRALKRGEVTSGIVKIVGIGAIGLVTAWMVTQSATQAVIGGAAIAGSANLLNLFDLRPGRASKVGLLHLPVLVLSIPAPALGLAAFAAVAALLPGDLRERTMLGDCGANALGAVLGLAVVAVSPLWVQCVYLAVLVILTLASEKVSFSAVIAANPALKFVDDLGRLRPAEPTA